MKAVKEIKQNGSIHVMTIDPTQVALNQRRHLPPPNQVHQKKKGAGSYRRNKLKEEPSEMS